MLSTKNKIIAAALFTAAAGFVWNDHREAMHADRMETQTTEQYAKNFSKAWKPRIKDGVHLISGRDRKTCLLLTDGLAGMGQRYVKTLECFNTEQAGNGKAKTLKTGSFAYEAERGSINQVTIDGKDLPDGKTRTCAFETSKHIMPKERVEFLGCVLS